MIERAEGDHAETHAGPSKHACRGAHAAVASANHNSVDLAALGAHERALDSVVQSFAFDEADIGLDVMEHERGAKRALDVLSQCLAEGAGACIHQRHDL